jgi:hypothetical protein
MWCPSGLMLNLVYTVAGLQVLAFARIVLTRIAISSGDDLPDPGHLD